MNLLKFVPIKLTILLIIGIIIGFYNDFIPSVAICITLILVLSLGYFLRKSTRENSGYFGITVLVTTIFIGILAITLWKPKNHEDHYSHLEKSEIGIIHLKIVEVLKPNHFSNRYTAKVKSIDGTSASGKVILSVSKKSDKNAFFIDQEILTYDSFTAIKPPLNPHQFNYKNYLHKLGIYDQIVIQNQNYTLLKNSTPTSYGVAAQLRSKIISSLHLANFGKEELSIIQALLLGQKNDISEATYSDYKNAGAVHILALSGLHIGILLLLLQFVLKPLEYLPKGKTIKLITTVLLLWCFAFLAGLSASIIRAVTMFSFVAYALYLNRPSNTYNILALSMFFILLIINPTLLFQAGFQMSYAAVFAIVWLYPILQKLWTPKQFIFKKIWQLLSVSLAAQIGVLPLSLFYFHQFPGLFFISNLIIVPFLGVILGIGILVIILAVFQTLPQFLSSFYNAIIATMNTLIGYIANQEAFIFKSISFDALQLILAYLFLIGFAITKIKTTFKKVAFVVAVLIGLQGYTLYTKYQSRKKEAVLVMHQTKNTIIANRTGLQLQLFSNSFETTSTINSYMIGERITELTSDSLKDAYTFKGKNLAIIDSSGVHTSTKVHTILLTQSPKINLERLIDSIRPQQIIVDGSNYSSYIKRWKATCLKRKLPFHYTGEKGAYYFE